MIDYTIGKVGNVGNEEEGAGDECEDRTVRMTKIYVATDNVVGGDDANAYDGADVDDGVVDDGACGGNREMLMMMQWLPMSLMMKRKVLVIKRRIAPLESF